MSVKYHCEKCERRFVDWGAEKLKFKCPDCGEKLVAISPARTTTTSKKKPALRRVTAKAKPKPKPKVKVVTTLSGDTRDELATEAPSEIPADAPADVPVEDDAATPDFSADDDEAPPGDDPKKK